MNISNLLATNGPPLPPIVSAKDIILDECGGNGVPTPFGCIPIEDSVSIAKSVASIGLGIGGAIALMLMGVASFQIMASAGDPRKLQAARELFFAAISGLIMIIFAGFILRLIGVDVLGLF